MSSHRLEFGSSRLYVGDALIVLYTMHDDAQLEAEAKKIGIRKVVSKANSAKLVAELEEIMGKPITSGRWL